MTEPRPHVLDRLQERYGIVLSITELRAVERRIRDGRGVTMKASRDGETSTVAILIGDRAVLVVWDVPKKIIRTALPPGNATAAGAKQFRLDRARLQR